MAILEDVEVTIVSTSTNQPLVEFEDPDPKTEQHGKEVRQYIEAVTGEEFKVVVRLKKGFNYHGADGITISLYLDGNALRRSLFKPLNSRTGWSGVLAEDDIYEWRTFLSRNQDNWSDIAFSFGAADVGSSKDSPSPSLR